MDQKDSTRAKTIEKTIEIHAAPVTVWRVLTVPSITRQIGGEYETDWRVGSALNWRDKDGLARTEGTIVAIEPATLLAYDQFDRFDPALRLATITLKLRAHANGTILSVKEALTYPMIETEVRDFSERWGHTLAAVKSAAERLA